MFADYESLVHKVDSRLEQLPDCGCPRGCDQCCRISFSLFPVEAFYLRRAFLFLPSSVRGRVREGMSTRGDLEHCPFLLDHACLLYRERPIICRTHGYPFYCRDEEEPETGRLYPGCEQIVDPSGFQPQSGQDQPLPALDLDYVNEMLVAVHFQFLRCPELTQGELPQRIPISEIPLSPFMGGLFDAHL